MNQTIPRIAFIPYPGLRPFSSNEAHIFFGRDDQIDKLLDRLNKSHFVAVVGPSGCGKSSLVKAGLIPALKTGFFLEVGTRWKIVEMRPGDKPFNNLANAINDSFDENNPIGLLIAELKTGKNGLVEALKSYQLEENENYLLIVDQFEELFRYKQNDNVEEVTAFINLLINSSLQRELSLHVILTMRSDFLGECSLFPGLPEILNDTQFLTPRLTREQTQEAIEGPAKVCGGVLEQHLVTTLLNDIKIDHDQLPILQHSLMRMWNLSKDRIKKLGSVERLKIDSLDYLFIGKLKHALTKHADEAYDGLTSKQKKIAEVMFKRLTERNFQLKDVRRPSQIEDITFVARVSFYEVIDTAEIFRSAEYNFITSTDTVLKRSSYIDISHESIMRQWERLDRWIMEEYEAITFYKQLLQAAEKHKKGKTELIRGVDLENALKWKHHQKPNKAWASRYSEEGGYEDVFRFLLDSLSKEKLELQEVRKRDLQQRMKDKEKEEEQKAKAKEREAQLKEEKRLREIAEKNEKEAKEQKKSAEIARLDAERQKRKAEKEKENAEIQSKIVEKQKNEILEQRRKARFLYFFISFLILVLLGGWILERQRSNNIALKVQKNTLTKAIFDQAYNSGDQKLALMLSRDISEDTIKNTIRNLFFFDGFDTSNSFAGDNFSNDTVYRYEFSQDPMTSIGHVFKLYKRGQVKEVLSDTSLIPIGFFSDPSSYFVYLKNRSILVYDIAKNERLAPYILFPDETPIRKFKAFFDKDLHTLYTSINDSIRVLRINKNTRELSEERSQTLDGKRFLFDKTKKIIVLRPNNEILILDIESNSKQNSFRDVDATAYRILRSIDTLIFPIHKKNETLIYNTSTNEIVDTIEATAKDIKYTSDLLNFLYVGKDEIPKLKTKSGNIPFPKNRIQLSALGFIDNNPYFLNVESNNYRLIVFDAKKVSDTISNNIIPFADTWRHIQAKDKKIYFESIPFRYNAYWTLK